ncbi:mevalonate kinase [Nitrosarchaeum sp. AC2]|uniref:mevalonate kinase n=1 Tax=Nitrosarchaeum sp. AC2 TaxID=2259673 RepID=UPI0015CD5AB4|nr:mevalonate kinase [Nitrosarchaeum sp. AC2]QLH10383.1 mevalonate kinase [Nitrosarchaeum sp. AC2]
MISKASAPGKVILFGEHFVVYGIKAILCAIDKRVTVTAEKIPENKIIIKSNIGELEVSLNKSMNEISSPLKPFVYLANKMIKKYNQSEGIKIYVKSEIPSGVGLGSSSACCVAGAAAISKLFEKTSKEKILELAIEAERTIFQNTSGADCTVCTFGGLMEYDKEKGFSQIKSEPNFHLVIANSNIEHSTEVVVSNVKQFKEKNEEKFSIMCQKELELVNRVKIMLKNNDLQGLGKCMKDNQEFLEIIGISNEKLRKMIEKAENSSFGAKITGAGGGGCIIALSDESNLEKIISELKMNDYECFSVKIDFKGLDTF